MQHRSLNSHLHGWQSKRRKGTLAQVETAIMRIPVKLATPKGSLDPFAAMMLDIILKIIIKDVNSKSELSTRKYKPMMVLNDGIAISCCPLQIANPLYLGEEYVIH